MTHTRSQKGFTLLELMTAIGLMAIMAAIAAPAFNSWLERSNLKAEAREVFGAFQRSRSEAVTRNNDIVLSFTEGIGGAGTWKISDSGTVIVEGEMISGVQINNADFNGTLDTGFNARGLPLEEGSVEVKNSDKTYTVTLTPAGSVKME